MKTQPTESQLYTTGQFAKLIGYHQETVRRLAREEKIKTIRFGRSYRIPQSEVDRILKVGLPSVE